MAMAMADHLVVMGHPKVLHRVMEHPRHPVTADLLHPVTGHPHLPATEHHLLQVMGHQLMVSYPIFTVAAVNDMHLKIVISMSKT